MVHNIIDQVHARNRPSGLEQRGRRLRQGGWDNTSLLPPNLVVVRDTFLVLRPVMINLLQWTQQLTYNTRLKSLIVIFIIVVARFSLLL